MSFSGLMTLGVRDVGSLSINEEFNSGETNMVGNIRRSMLKFHSNQNKHAYGKERDLRILTVQE